jgi:hypothetical protein
MIELAAKAEILSMGEGGGGEDQGKVVEESKWKECWSAVVGLLLA